MRRSGKDARPWPDCRGLDLQARHQEQIAPTLNTPSKYLGLLYHALLTLKSEPCF